jgi:Ca-activated chloride channel family protein
MQSVETFSQSVASSADGPPPARIVLMSDGKQTVPGGMTPEEEPRGSFTAARAAQKAGIPVSTISFGTAYGSIEINPGERTPVAVDDDSMQRIADLSGGQFFTAATEEELRRVYDDLSEQIGYETRRVDVSWPWLAGGVMLLVVGVASGMVLGRRLP